VDHEIEVVVLEKVGQSTSAYTGTSTRVDLDKVRVVKGTVQKNETIFVVTESHGMMADPPAPAWAV
jgi:hypothetical protein